MNFNEILHKAEQRLRCIRCGRIFPEGAEPSDGLHSPCCASDSNIEPEWFVEGHWYSMAELYEHCERVKGLLEERTHSVRMILLSVGSSYGKERFYPANQTARLLSALTGRKTFARSELDILRRLDFRIEFTLADRKAEGESV